MKLESIGLVVHGGKPVAIQAAEVVRGWAADHGAAVTELDVWTTTERSTAREELAQIGSVDLIVTIGGDGTFLRSIAAAELADAPVLGVNVGRLGFLTEVETGDVIAALEAYGADEAVLESRMTLTLRANRALEIPPELQALLEFGRGPALPPPDVRAGSPEEVGWGDAVDVTSLNDIVFEKLSRDRQASLGVYIGSRLFMSYSADALVVATPTGSTAYSFSAGGPIVSPRAEAIVFTPIAAHMVFNRSLVLSADEVISVRVLEKSGRVVLSVDGQIRGVLDPGDWVSVYAKTWRAQLVRLDEPDFFGRVRERFDLRDSAAALADGQLPDVYLPGSPPPADMGHLHIPTVRRVAAPQPE